MPAYYNEFDPYAAQWLRNLIAAGHIAPGDVDERSIVDVQPDDLTGYSQCHFFAGIGGWSLAARLAGWDDASELWTGSCPCQPFSVAGKGAGQADERHLWPEQFRLIRARRPAVWMGEQVAAAVGKHWLDGVHSDLESIGYASRAVVVPACAVDAPHRRDRAWIVADASGGRCAGSDQGQSEQPGRAKALGAGEGAMGDTIGAGLEGQRRHGDDRDEPGRIDAQSAGPTAETGGSNVADADRSDDQCGSSEGSHLCPAQNCEGSDNHDSGRGKTAWAGAEWLAGADGKARRVEPSIRLLAHGVPARVGRLRAYGNAIVPQVAAEIIGAYMDCQP